MRAIHILVYLTLLSLQVAGTYLSRYSGNNYRLTLLRRRPSSRPSSDVIRDVISQAVNIVKAEDGMLRNRFIQDVDRELEEYRDVDPNLFIDSPLPVSLLSRRCRLINWIGRLAREKRLRVPMTQILRHSEAQRHDVTCPFKLPTCSPAKPFRTIDGTCNNPRRPYLGAAFTAFKRESKPAYERENTYLAGTICTRDDKPRTTGVNRRPLPNPREISVRVHQSNSNTNPESTVTFIFTLWGQFLAHDLTDRAPGKGFKDVPLECCDQTVKTPKGICSNMDIPPGDFFRKFGRRCLAFARSAEVTDFDCSGANREVLNLASSFLDGGSIYGVDLNKLRRLRAFTGGLLETSQMKNLPISTHPNAKAAAQGFSFFLAGDDRVNEFTGLIGIETVWVREHNRIAQILSRYNPLWDDERIFLETRRIIISMLQHITYNEYLPKIIAEDLLRKFDLKLQADGYYRGYDSAVDPRVSNLFATVALRFGHSMMRSTFTLVDEKFKLGRTPALTLRNLFFTPIIFLNNEDSIMRGMSSDASETCDRIVTKEFVNHLYQTKTGNGFDLPAFNIQRGRDHGLGGYNHWRSHYGLSIARSFTTSQTSGFRDHDQETVNRFKAVYSHPDDVDPWTGGVSELTGSRHLAVGPLFQNIIAHQFQVLRKGE
ncbi:peroxidasin-like [Liolophura sinensis]|uniref:peroxidasin-like n=1 Tax=Liolophura sinensis TaxID=3198878 RepID=UPI003159602B